MVSSFILELMPTICENLHCLQIFTHIWQIINKIWHRLSQISDHHTQREASAISKGRYDISESGLPCSREDCLSYSVLMLFGRLKASSERYPLQCFSPTARVT